MILGIPPDSDASIASDQSPHVPLNVCVVDNQQPDFQELP